MLRETSSASVKFISIQRNELISALTSIAAQIGREHPEVKSLRLFGSVARGDQVGTSDADVMLILRGDETFDTLEAIRAYLPYFKLPLGVDVLVFSEADIERRLKSDDRFMQQIWAESLILFEAKDDQVKGSV
jgi:predicted nucleotidyltransferase